MYVVTFDARPVTPYGVLGLRRCFYVSDQATVSYEDRGPHSQERAGFRQRCHTLESGQRVARQLRPGK